jgi:hypothetical protein
MICNTLPDIDALPELYPPSTNVVASVTLKREDFLSICVSYCDFKMVEKRRVEACAVGPYGVGGTPLTRQRGWEYPQQQRRAPTCAMWFIICGRRGPRRVAARGRFGRCCDGTRGNGWGNFQQRRASGCGPGPRRVRLRGQQRGTNEGAGPGDNIGCGLGDRGEESEPCTLQTRKVWGYSQQRRATSGCAMRKHEQK